MGENKVCPICKGEKFIKTRRVTLSGYQYEFYRECECLNPKKPKKQKTANENPFEEEGGKSEEET